jgi:hypothetical protein
MHFDELMGFQFYLSERTKLCFTQTKRQFISLKDPTAMKKSESN